MSTDIKLDENIEIDLNDLLNNNLVLWNDDHNSFDTVIVALIKVVRQTQEQAEQCALIAHTKGRCKVKSGSMKELRPLREGLIEFGLNATIE